MSTPSNSGPQSPYGAGDGYPPGAQPIPEYDAPPTAVAPIHPANPYGAPANPYGPPANPYGPPVNPYGPPQPAQTGVPYNAYGPPPRPTNGMAVTGFVLSLVGLIPYLGLLLALGGLVFSLIGMSQTKRTGEGGRGLAIAGLCISGVIIAGYVVVIVIALVLVGAAGTGAYYG